MSRHCLAGTQRAGGGDAQVSFRLMRAPVPVGLAAFASPETRHEGCCVGSG
jgi:hypothetical protein